ncbi:MAG: hypothetical protein KBG22_00900 [Smithella sp.]|nr:hypothetical protein [Smithella sp.]MDM7988147.1 hypothetical protein [Smithella sp.]
MDFIEKLKEKSIKKKNVSTSEALELFVEGTGNPYRVLAAASEIREHFKGKDIILCGMTHLISAKCTQECTSRASFHSNPDHVSAQKIKTARQVLAEAVQAKKNGAEFFSIITGSEGLKTKKAWKNICQIIPAINKSGIKPCLAAGMIDANQAAQLKAVGLLRYCHHLQNDGKEDRAMMNAVKAAGLSVCAGVSFGIGETFTQRIQSAEVLRKLNVDAVSINMIDSGSENKRDRAQTLSPMEILMTVAVFRFMLPDKDIKLCGGRKNNLRQLLPLGIIAGANSLMTGNDLNATERNSKLDHEMIADLGLIPTREIDLCTCGTKGKQRCAASSAIKSRSLV